MLRAPFSSEFDPSEEAGVSVREGEAPFLRKLSGCAPAELKQLLTAIDAYEAFGRAITDAFNGLRNCASINRGAPVDAKAFSAAKAAKTALEALGPSLARTRLSKQRDPGR